MILKAKLSTTTYYKVYGWVYVIDRYNILKYF